MKLVTYDSMKFIVDASNTQEAIMLAIEANLAFLEVWKDNPTDERYEEYVREAKKGENYTVVDLSLDALDNLIQCKKELYSGVYGRALVFNE